MRALNQDAVGHVAAEDGSQVFVLADGIGGFERGEEASRAAVAAVCSAWPQDPGQQLSWRLARCVKMANDAVFDRARELELSSPTGTTLVMLALDAESAVLANVGDSRAYRLRRGKLEQLSTDHTEAQEMADRDELDPSLVQGHELSHMLTRCLGVERAVEPDFVGPVTRCDDDVYLLCSDGLSGMVADQELRDLLSYLPFEQQKDALIALANRRGGHDNISLHLLRLGTANEALERRPAGYRFEHERRARWPCLVLALVVLGAACLGMVWWWL